jgi:hypothetical protein
MVLAHRTAVVMGVRPSQLTKRGCLKKREELLLSKKLNELDRVVDVLEKMED